jgi:hypothetical protein
MTRVVRRAETRGSISLRIRLDLTTIEPARRAAAIGSLTESLDAGSTVELIVAPIDDQAAVTAHLTELVDGGIHIHLCGPPDQLHDWLSALHARGGA